MKNIKFKILYSLFALAIIAGNFFGVYKYNFYNDYFSIHFSENSKNNETKIIDNALTPDMFAGNKTLTYSMQLKKGTYDFGIKYTSDISMVPVTVVEASQYDFENRHWPIHEVANLNSGSGIAKTEFTVKKDAQDVIVCLDYSAMGNVTIHDISIKSQTPVYQNKMIVSVFLAICVAVTLFAVFIVLFSKKTNRAKLISFFVIFVICIATVLGSIVFFTANVSVGNDSSFHYMRIQGLASAIENHQLPHRVNLAFNQSLGYLNPVFYGEAFLFLPAALMVMGADTSLAYNIFLVVLSLASVLIAYYSFKKMSHSTAVGLASAVLYALSICRLRNIFFRVAVGEFLFITFLPLAVYGLYNIFFEKRKNWYIFAIACTCILQSHILGTMLTAFLCTILIIVFGIISLCKKTGILKQIGCLFAALITIIAINIGFIMPFLHYYPQDFQYFDYSRYAENFSKDSPSLKTIFFGMDELVGGWQFSNLGFILGLTIVFALGVCIYLIIKKQNIVLPCVFLVLGCFFAFLSSNLLPTEMLIKNELIFNILTKIQFPFRFITLATICFVTFFALVFKKAMPKNLRQIACVTIIFATILSTGIFYMTNQKPDYKGSSLAISTKSPPEYLM
ncbi:MAG: hypothetical protein RR902_04500, partial [Oscillospiraceae bacterium]